MREETHKPVQKSWGIGAGWGEGWSLKEHLVPTSEVTLNLLKYVVAALLFLPSVWLWRFKLLRHVNSTAAGGRSRPVRFADEAPIG